MISDSFLNRLKDILGPSHVDHSEAGLLTYAYDATPNFQSKPDVVVMPGNTEEVSKIVKLCLEHEVPIVPRGSGTNLAAGTAPTQGGLVLLFNRMDQILEIDKENLTATVQPGVITQTICETVESQGLFYPPDPSSMKISTIGGNINENSGGLRGLKYGVTKDYILGLEVVLPNGDIIQTGGKLAKDVAGYDITKLLVGSEGTLGIVTEAILKLIPKPEHKQTLLAVYQSMDQAAETVSSIIAQKITPATLEFMDQPTIGAVEEYAHIGLPTEAEAVLLIEQDGPQAIVENDIEQIADICEKHGALEVTIAETEQEANQLREGRRAALSAIARLSPTTILEDATVPRSEIARMVQAINQIAEKYNVGIATFGHAGDGNLHPTCMTDARDEDEMERVEKAFEEIFAHAIECGGTITGEHGVGEMKSPYLAWKVGERGLEAMKNIKTAFDPHNIMNPGKMFAKDTKKRITI
ncbi:glycolate oxidase subunit GlcD [Tenuibacillus multivorans]|uniref:Glycolate oxidase n=1 Tax=Tenuibacillus multivorans TaxID=237069 RepID=A0A1H0C5J1_9BACI|nr:glycolate oxidase subunit GlcD [Tenuibacillus multivorans]GEL77773.1 glycolate oxidase subunit GlcD [Tenuibacillus multivorans]SDN53133.1 glycolate oxidase [Tenuibacillus multivorans]